MLFRSPTCADVTSLWSQVEIKSILYEEPSRLAVGSSPFNEAVGQITTTAGPVVAQFNLASLGRFIQSRRADNIFIDGSVQRHDNQTHVVAKLGHGKQAWAWDHHQQKETLVQVIDDLAYHAANRIMGQTSQLIDVLPGAHFKTYTHLLSSFITYLQASSPIEINRKGSEAAKRPWPRQESKPSDDGSGSTYSDKVKTLIDALEQFRVAEPTDVRTYYMLYIMGIIAISNRQYDKAKEWLEHASKIETSVAVSI